jgi:hypothetical protein
LIGPILVTAVDLADLERARHGFDRARLFVALAAECDDARDREYRRMLLDGAVDALVPAYAELASVLRLFAIRVRWEHRRAAEQEAARTKPPSRRQAYRTKKYLNQTHRR